MSLLQKFLKKKNPSTIHDEIQPTVQTINNSIVDLPRLESENPVQVDDLISNISKLLEPTLEHQGHPKHLEPTLEHHEHPEHLEPTPIFLTETQQQQQQEQLSEPPQRKKRKRKREDNNDQDSIDRDLYSKRIITSAIQGLSVSEVRKALCEVRNCELQSNEKRPFYITDVLSNNMSIDEFCLKFVCGHHNKRHKGDDDNDINDNVIPENKDDKKKNNTNDDDDEEHNEYSD